MKTLSQVISEMPPDQRERISRAFADVLEGERKRRELVVTEVDPDADVAIGSVTVKR